MAFTAESLKRMHKSIKGTIELFDPTKKVEALASGSIVIDKLSGIGGYPLGRITEIYGDYSSGKTTLALHAIKSCQKVKKAAVFLDFEETFDTLYAKSLGIKTKTSELLVIQPKTLEAGWSWLKENLGDLEFAEEVGVIVFDSIAAMTPEALLNGDPNTVDAIGLQARKIASFIPWLTKIITKFSIPVIMLNQERLNLAKALNKFVGGPDTLSTGGKALQFYNSLKFHLKIRGSEVEKRRNPITGEMEDTKVLNLVRVNCVKNKVGVPFLRGEIAIRFGTGIDNFTALFGLSLGRGIIKLGGGGYCTYKSFLNGEEIRIRGKSSMLEFFKENPKEYKALEKWFLESKIKDDENDPSGLGTLTEEEIDVETVDDMEILKKSPKKKTKK